MREKLNALLQMRLDFRAGASRRRITLATKQLHGKKKGNGKEMGETNAGKGKKELVRSVLMMIICGWLLCT